MAPKQWRVSFDVARGTFSTSHVAECPDVAPECAVLFIAPHFHRARNTVTHMGLSAQYGLSENVQLSLTVPYEIKAMRIRYETLDGTPFSPPYGDIHHRTQTLSGVADAEIGVQWGMGNDFIAGTGITLPIGRIEPNPIVLGRQGREHQHMQFGSGAFQPIVSLQYSRPGKIGLFGRAEAKLSVYENREGFRAPAIFLWSAGPRFSVGRVAIQPRFEGQHQTIGRWDGEIDEGSGFTNGGIRLGVSLPAGSFTIAPAVYREIFSEGLHDETFRQGTTWSFAVSRTY